jgi:hypothetical protein
MWVSRREMARILKQLKRAESRATELERALHAERERNRTRENELLNRALTAAGCYALPKERPDKPVNIPVMPRGVEYTALEEAIRDAYREAAAEAGHSRQDADAMFERRRRGEMVTPNEPFGIDL